MNEVEWKPIPGTAYAASPDGRIRRELPGPGARVGRVLRPWLAGGRSGCEYEYVDVHGKKEAVHILVALAFHGPKPSPHAVVDHVDEDKTNNRPDNLQWVRQSVNIRRWHAARQAPPEPDSADAHLPSWAAEA